MKTSLSRSNNIEFQYKKQNGRIILNGRFLSLNPEELWNNILSSSEELARKTDKIQIELNIEYISSTDVKYLYLLLKTVISVRNSASNITIKWGYEPFDDDHFDLGQLLKNSFPNITNFQFVENWTKMAA